MDTEIVTSRATYAAPVTLEADAVKLTWHNPEMIILTVNRETKAAPGSAPIT